MNRFVSLNLLAATLVGFAGATSAADPVPTTSFNLIGYIQQFRMCVASDGPWCADPNDPRAGAIMKVNGITVIVPKNSYVVMPGSYLKPKDIFDKKLPVAGVGQSGLALEDTPPPAYPYTADLIGNIVDGEYRAGLVNIMQLPLQTASGFIKDITADGEMLIGPALNNPAVSMRVRLNDPDIGTGTGRYGKAQSADERFRADQGNPTVHAATGYPLCVPKPATPECPASNRPNGADGKPLHRFTVGTTAALNDAPACGSACNANKMVPLAVDDYVTYTGILVKEPTASDPNASYISASALEADLGIFTEKGKNPAYVFIEEALLGSGGSAFPGLDQETGPGKVVPGQNLVTRFRIVGFTTDPSRNVDVFALDAKMPIEKGKFTERLLSSVRPEPVAPMGRFRITVDQQVFMPPTREIRARIQGILGSSVLPPAEPAKAANGLIYGEYTAPVAEYIFPEGRVFGAKKPLPGAIPANFEDLCFLSRGWWPEDEDKPLQALEPWPESGHDRLSSSFCN
ncbi:hypothetical protein [Methylomonas fluvii]|uniref:Uncharacterized protein n=1 Tax=Methylomonas fluvii TaxID=1854564 RepID=A0ABR9DHI7_9GAMM|nr:hypothetical protein [Methylomonas fluvii]MBD9361748.1 hypothetical protein [Methylomonas fluvii]